MFKTVLFVQRGYTREVRINKCPEIIQLDCPNIGQLAMCRS
jgi:hypothetical protein